MAVIRIIAATDDGEFPYAAAKAAMLARGDLVIGEVDFPAMIEAGKRIGWPQALVDSAWAHMQRGKCFTFVQDGPPGLQGTLYEDNIFFDFGDGAHQVACEPVIEQLAHQLGARITLG